MNRRKLLQRILLGAHQNLSYSDFIHLLEGLGFHHVRTRGSHRVYLNPSIPATISLQPAYGQAKPYQVREVMRMIERYNLSLEDES
jgi:predicted RNA binding protein YcfA (HicA-like mRNA interferase family)